MESAVSFIARRTFNPPAEIRRTGRLQSPRPPLTSPLPSLPDGVTVAQATLTRLVKVQILVGQLAVTAIGDAARTMKIRPSFLLPTAMLLVSACAATSTATTSVPTQFLRTDNPAWQRILATKITADFRHATLREAIHFIAQQSQANVVVALRSGSGFTPPVPGAAPTAPGGIPPLEPPGPTPSAPVSLPKAPPEPTIKRRFTNAPLRVVLYRISQDAGLKVDWLYVHDFPQAIQIRGK